MTDKPTPDQLQFYADYYGQVEGKIRYCGTKDGFPMFKVMREDGIELTLELSRDEEGNGPGFMFIGAKEPEWLLWQRRMSAQSH
tara:strand:- start:2725 stop:2976 length:252 start_codon:yes stop_codon:yes gene_type:complete